MSRCISRFSLIVAFQHSPNSFTTVSSQKRTKPPASGINNDDACSDPNCIPPPPDQMNRVRVPVLNKVTACIWFASPVYPSPPHRLGGKSTSFPGRAGRVGPSEYYDQVPSSTPVRRCFDHRQVPRSTPTWPTRIWRFMRGDPAPRAPGGLPILSLTFPRFYIIIPYK